MNKKTRELVYQKYDGKCAYTGTVLKEDWQVDHLKAKFLFDIGYYTGNPNDIKNLVPAQKIVNHYKRSLPLEDFRNWLLGGLHERLKKLPKNPKVEKSIKRKEYLLEVASLFGITENKPFDKVFYFEKL